jgi:CheY-like chemotaxis protein
MSIEPVEVAPEFVRQVRDLLARLFDAVHLQHHPLGPELVPPSLVDPRARAQFLREAVTQAVQALKPPSHVSPHDAAYRPYGILRHRYLEGMEPEDVQGALAIGRRQYFREQQRAVRAIAALLWAERLPSRPADPGHRQSLNDELESLGVRSQPVQLGRVAQEAIAAVHPLAATRGIGVSVRDDERVRALADEDVTRQVVIEVLGVLLGRCSACFFEVEVGSASPWATVTVTAPLLADGASLDGALLTAARLGGRMGGSLTTHRRDDRCSVVLRLPVGADRVVAIVDDNATTLQLFRRYLEPYSFRPVAIQDSSTAVDEIRRLRPDAVVLDIMMRDVDGWRILQALRADPATTHTPVLVCSVLSDEQLALTIGATAYLRKPVSQGQLVRALSLALQGRDDAPGMTEERSRPTG